MGSQELPRIWFSTNDRVAIDRYGLWLPKSKADLERLGSELREGLRVMLYEPGELEMEATLAFDPDYKAWIATGDGTTILYAPGSGGEHLNP